MPTLLCVPIMVEDEPTALRDAAEARDAGADIVEFRIDDFFSGAAAPGLEQGADGDLDEREVRAIQRLISNCPLPCIVTCRSSSESGGPAAAGVAGYGGDDMSRIALFEKLGVAAEEREASGALLARMHPPRYIDVELATYARSANIRQRVDMAVDYPAQRRSASTGLILSMHDFAGRPSDLMRRIEAIASEPAARVAKIVITARSVRDNLELFDLLAEHAAGKPTIALAMGRFGLMSRVLAPKFGAFLTFGALRPGAGTAPGQPTVRELLEVYRFRSIGRRTRVLGLIGWPVEHSLSPTIHNAGFDAFRRDSWDDSEADACDAVYLPLPVGPEYEHFKATLGSLVEHARLDFAGCSVTTPHKQHLVRFAHERIAAGDDRWTLDPLSELAGAANTLVVERDAGGNLGAARVLNTDAAAATQCLRDALGELCGRRIVLLGAGGVARAFAAGLLLEGASVTVSNRAREGADRLIADLTARLGRAGAAEAARLQAADPGALASEPPDAIVNCTPVGMKDGPAPKGMPIEPAALEAIAKAGGRAGREGGAVVFDTVYNPLRTPLIERAQALGLKTINGLGMFLGQAGAQFTAWTGRPAPMGLFERICRDALGG